MLGPPDRLFLVREAVTADTSLSPTVCSSVSLLCERERPNRLEGWIGWRRQDRLTHRLAAARRNEDVPLEESARCNVPGLNS